MDISASEDKEAETGSSTSELAEASAAAAGAAGTDPDTISPEKKKEDRGRAKSDVRIHRVHTVSVSSLCTCLVLFENVSSQLKEISTFYANSDCPDNEKYFLETY